jgi:hypothetical protein
VALVVCFTGWLPRHKSKATAGKKKSLILHSCLLGEVQDPINYQLTEDMAHVTLNIFSFSIANQPEAQYL